MARSTGQKDAAHGGEAVVRCVGVQKRFGATDALKDVDLTLRKGEVVALLGENGAGKSTLVRCISGEVEAASGTVEIAGRPLNASNPIRAAELGVTVIHQELSYAPNLTVAENVLLSRLPARLGFVDRRECYRLAREFLHGLAPDVDVEARMGELRVGDRQLVEIARAVHTGGVAVLMDEPTAALNAGETEALFRSIAVLKGRGVGVLYISHRLEEVLRIADRGVVMRDGAVVAEYERAASVSREQIVTDIVGRELGAALQAPPPAARVGEPRLELRGVGVAGRLEGIDLSVRPAEIVGFFGLGGSGAEHVADAIYGARKGYEGSVVVDGKAIGRRDPRRCRRAGIALVPADRREAGIFAALSIGTNVSLAKMSNRGLLGLTTPRGEAARGQEWIKAIDIRPVEPKKPVGLLSGGNQQKTVFARWLAIEPRILVLDEPTRGVDVGAKAQMYELIRDAAAGNSAVVIISTELEELMAICARIAVVSRGHVTGVYDTAVTDQDQILDLAIGGHV